MILNCNECGRSDSEYYFDGSCMTCVTKRLENETLLKERVGELLERIRTLCEICNDAMIVIHNVDARNNIGDRVEQALKPPTNNPPPEGQGAGD